MKLRYTIMGVLIAAAVSPAPAPAGFLLLTSRAAVVTPDTLDWATLGGSATSVPAGATVTSTGNRAATLPNGAFLLVVGFNQGFNAGFDLGQIVIYTAGSDIVYQFANPVSAAGSQVWGASSASAITVTALDAAGNPLAGGSFTPAVGGGGGNVSFGSAGFVGVQGTAGTTFSGLRFSNSPQAYAVNFASFTPEAAPSGVALPLPPTAVAGLLGTLGLLAAALRRRG
jgi:hypothetical protein